MISRWVPYLAKGPGLTSIMTRKDSNCGRILGHWRLFESDFNNGTSPGHFNLGSDGTYASSGLPLMVFLWVQYQAKGPRPDFSNSPGDNSNSGCILSPSVYWSLTRKTPPPPGHFNPGQMENTFVQVSYLWAPGGYNCWPRAQA